MSSYNVPLVEAMVANCAPGSRDNNTLLYPRVSNNPHLGDIAKGKQKIAHLLDSIAKGKSKDVPGDQQQITDLRQMVETLNALASVKATRTAIREMIESNMSLVVGKVARTQPSLISRMI